MRRGGALLLALAPLGAQALEPRFDHRDQLGPAVEVVLASDTVAEPRRTSRTTVGPALRLAFGFDPTGDGNDLIVGARLAWPRPDAERVRVRAALDARYRAYFLTEAWKTFLEVGLFLPVSSRLGAGPMVGLGAAYDFGRSGGVWAGASLATAFGSARFASAALALGAQLRFQ